MKEVVRFFVLTIMLFGAVLMLVGCGPDKEVPLPPSKLAPPNARLMADCPDLPDVPKDEHKSEKARARYYVETREQYVACRQDKRDLQSWAKAATAGK